MPEFTFLGSKEYHSLLPNTFKANLIAVFTTRHFANMSLTYGDAKEALTCRRNFLISSGIDYKDLICAKQIHSNHVRYVTENNKGSGALSYDTSISDTDAFISDRKNLPLAVFTADCLSIFLYDPIKPAIGLIHAGWRSSQENITTKTIELMQQQFNTKPLDLYVGLGPAIRSCCYKVGDRFREFFPLDVSEKSGSYYLDLIAANKRELLNLGVKEANIFDSGVCTSCQNEEFFSFRKEGKSCGRIMSVIMLRDSFKSR